MITTSTTRRSPYNREERAMSKTPATRVQVIGPNLFGAEHTFHVHVEGCADIARKPMYRRADGLTDGGVDLASKQAVVEYIYSDQIFSDNEGDPVWGKWDAYEPDFKWFPCLGEFPDTLVEDAPAPALSAEAFTEATADYFTNTVDDKFDFTEGVTIESVVAHDDSDSAFVVALSTGQRFLVAIGEITEGSDR